MTPKSNSILSSLFLKRATIGAKSNPPLSTKIKDLKEGASKDAASLPKVVKSNLLTNDTSAVANDAHAVVKALNSASFEDRFIFAGKIVPNGDFGFGSRVYFVTRKVKSADKTEVIYAAKLFLRKQEQKNTQTTESQAAYDLRCHREYNIGIKFTQAKLKVHGSEDLVLPEDFKSFAHHPSIHFVSICEMSKSALTGHWYQIMKFYEYGDLCTIIDDHIKRKTFMKRNVVCHWWSQIIFAVRWMHSLGISHGDLKPDNFFIARDGLTLLVSDFGMTQAYAANIKTVKSIESIGTLSYNAPELFEKQPHSKLVLCDASVQQQYGYNPFAVDVWACAVVYLVLSNLKLPWGKAVMRDPKFSSWVHGQFDPLPGVEEEGRLMILARMMCLNASKRPSLETVWGSNWFRQVVISTL